MTFQLRITNYEFQITNCGGIVDIQLLNDPIWTSQNQKESRYIDFAICIQRIKSFFKPPSGGWGSVKIRI
jgi:hypothetical protein